MADTTVDTARLLVISREDSLLDPLSSLGESNAWQVETALSGWEAMERVQSEAAPNLLLLDLPRGEKDSLHILRWLRRLRPELPILVTCYPEDLAQKKEAIRLGAEEVFVRPFDEDQLEVAIRRHLADPAGINEIEIASDEVESVGEDEFFLSASPVMQKLRAQAELLAQADVPVLILGEPGSGKRTVARLVHKLSIRSGFPFLRVNCAAVPGELLESELFGKSPSGNGIKQTMPGKLLLAEKGTLLLEEISEMPLSTQARLLQVLQDKHFLRSDKEKPVPVEVRILASSGIKIEQAIEDKKVREDLYYRLSAFTIHVPPLRKRREEIKMLLHYTMHKFARYYGLPPAEFSPAAIDACMNHTWPGNLQELESFVKRYMVAGDQELRFGSTAFLPASERGNGHSHSLGGQDTVMTTRETTQDHASLKSFLQSVKSEAERKAIAAALEKTGWNRKAAARMLRVSYRSLLYKIEQYRMVAPQAYAHGLPYHGANGNGKEYKGH